MLYTIYDKATGAIIRSGDLPDSEIAKLGKADFPPGSIIKYGEARTAAQPMPVAKSADIAATDVAGLRLQVADLLKRVAVLEKNLSPVKG